MLVNAKCAPHYIKTVLEHNETDLFPSEASAPIRVYSGEPAGAPRDALHGDKPNGDVTPCLIFPSSPVTAQLEPCRSLDVLDLSPASDSARRSGAMRGV
jgi:hypothetical protein